MIDILLSALPCSGSAFVDSQLKKILGELGYCTGNDALNATGTPRYLTWRQFPPGVEDCVEAANWLHIVIVRDLRDVVIYFAKHMLSQTPPLLPQNYSMADTIEMIVSHNLPRICPPLLELTNNPEVIIVHYERLLSDPLIAIDEIISKIFPELPRIAPRTADDIGAAEAWQESQLVQQPAGVFHQHFDVLTEKLFRIFLGTAQLSFGYRHDDLSETRDPNSRVLGFFSTSRRPYYIWAQGYRQSSAGIRCLHYLCHALNELGEEAYITPAQVLNPSLRTPPLTIDVVRRHFLTGRQPIALYPEVIAGNPLAAPVVARWLLNRPGHIGGDTTFGSGDLLFHFARWCLPEGTTGSHILNLPTVDTTVFNNDDNPQDAHRRGACYYANKFLVAGGRVAPEIASGALSLGLETPRTPQELAEIFRQAEMLYCHELTSLIPEAQACGCPVLIVPSDYWERHGDPNIIGRLGIELASPPGALAKARAEVGNYRCIDDATANYYWWQIERFVAVTQSSALSLADDGSSLWTTAKTERRARLAEVDHCYLPRLPAAGSSPAAVAGARPGALEIRLIDERLRQQPPSHIELVVVGEEANRSLLAATLSSLQAQDYPALSVTVIAPFSLADDYPPPLFQWQHRATEHWLAARQAVQESTADWCGIVRSGDRLLDRTLGLYACRARDNPRWQILFCDEALTDGQGNDDPPYLLPGFDIDLLRAGSCRFGFILARREAWQAAGGWRVAPCGLDTLDALLRLWERGGDDAFGHIAGVRYLRHRNNRPFLPSDPQIVGLRRQIVAEHLARSSGGEVVPGPHQDLVHVRYPTPALPKISLVVLTRDNGGGLEICLRSLLEHSAYPDFECLIVDNGSSEPGTRAYIDNLVASAPGNFRIAAFNQPFNLAAMCNAAAQIATGELLVFLHDDIEVLHAGWLHALAAQCLRPGVAMAAPLLVSPDGKVQEAGIIPMQFGICGNRFAGCAAQADDAGGLLRSAHAVPAVSAACMMVRRDVYRELGGMDATNFPTRAADIDFCLNLRKAGHKIIWTPQVTLLHDSDGTLRGNRHDNNALLAKWGSLLTDDLGFNPGFALDSNRLEPESDPAFQPDPLTWHPLPRIYAALLGDGTADRQRVEQVVRSATDALAIRGRVGSFLPIPVQLKRLGIDVVHCAAPLTTHQLRELANYRQLLGCRIIMDIDPLVDRDFDAGDPLRHVRQVLRQCDSVVDRFTTSSGWLAAQLPKWVDRIAIIADGIDPARWNFPCKNRENGKPRVGWHGRASDVEAIAPVIMALAGQVDWVFIGDFPEVIAPCVRERYQAVAFDDLPARLASLDLDLAVCPLVISTQNQCRSPLPILEYGALGIPVVATDIAAYAGGLPVMLTANTMRGWTEAILAHTAERSENRRRGAALRDFVMAYGTLQQQTEAWRQVWQR